MHPEVRQQATLVTVVSAANCAAEEHETGVIISSNGLVAQRAREGSSGRRPRVSVRRRRTNEQGSVVQTQSSSVAPRCDMDDRKLHDETTARRHEPMRRVLVSEQAVRRGFLLHENGGCP